MATNLVLVQWRSGRTGRPLAGCRETARDRPGTRRGVGRLAAGGEWTERRTTAREGGVVGVAGLFILRVECWRGLTQNIEA